MCFHHIDQSVSLNFELRYNERTLKNKEYYGDALEIGKYASPDPSINCSVAIHIFIEFGKISRVNERQFYME